MRTVCTLIVKILCDPDDASALRGTLLVPGQEQSYSFQSEQALIQLLRKVTSEVVYRFEPGQERTRSESASH